MTLIEDPPSGMVARDPQLLFAEARERRRRRWAIGGILTTVVALGLILAAVGVFGWNPGEHSSEHSVPAAPVVHRGVLDGIAGECTGIANLPAHPVQVIVYRGSHVVIRQSQLGSHPFSFSLPPGKYRVTTDQSYVTPVNVTVSSDQITHAAVLSSCD